MRRATTAGVLAATCLAVAITAPAAMGGKTVTFSGPIDLAYTPSPAGFAHSPPTIKFKVSFDGKRPKSIPVGTLKAEGLYGSCSFGAYGCNAYPGEPAHCYTTGGPFDDDNGFRIKKKKFSGTMGEEIFGFLTVTGRIGKSSATGTVHGWYSRPATSDHPAATCDTGVLSWSASK